MSGIYLHIPFCKQACHYCDFHFSTSLNGKTAFLSALKKEIALRKDYLSDKEIKTVYFGGGTPSLLTQKEISEIMEELSKYFSVSPKAEITLEANPDDLTPETLAALKKTSINRLSIGLQSFSDPDLIYMNRVHNAEEAKSSVLLAQQAGFDNITIDLIYGTPTMSNDTWRENLDKAFELNVQHISAYGLTVEVGTPLASFIKKGKLADTDEQKGIEQFNILMEEMQKHDFLQYEISNFCKEGFHSKHNSNYWKKEHYLGLGPSAHSFDGSSRQWNVSNNFLYVASLEKGELNAEREVLTIEQQYNEYVLTSLRTIGGANLEYILKSFGKENQEHCLRESKAYSVSGHLSQVENKLTLTNKGKLLADKIASDLFKTK